VAAALQQLINPMVATALQQLDHSSSQAGASSQQQVCVRVGGGAQQLMAAAARMDWLILQGLFWTTIQTKFKRPICVAAAAVLLQIMLVVTLGDKAPVSPASSNSMIAEGSNTCPSGPRATLPVDSCLCCAEPEKLEYLCALC
jgi:hypothetical protein